MHCEFKLQDLGKSELPGIFLIPCDCKKCWVTMSVVWSRREVLRKVARTGHLH